ncbi:MAG: outer membrane beta-barrel protein [Flavobacteriia bacterium]|jgi:hypothetical protein
MRKIALTVSLLISFSSLTQLQKNTFFIGGAIQPRGFNPLLSFPFSNFGGGITPTAGFMLSQKWALGLEFNYQAIGPKTNHYYESTYLGGFARYYFANEKRVAMYGNLSLGYKQMEYLTIDGKNKNSFVPAKIGLGASYFMTKNLSLDIQTNLNLNNPFFKNSLEGKFGISYYIRPKKKTITNKGLE